MKNSQTQQRSGRHRVREKLQEMILNGKIPSGTRLRQQELAAKFGCALGVVREALLELSGVGLVEVVDNSGAFVPELSVKTVLEAYDVREALEGIAARLCCDHASRQDLRELSKLAERQYELNLQSEQKKQNIESQLNAMDRQLHCRMLEISNNKMIQQVALRYHVLDAIWAPNDRGCKAVHDEHMAIIQAIEDNQPDLAERLTRQHIHAGKQGLERSISSGKIKLAWANTAIA